MRPDVRAVLADQVVAWMANGTEQARRPVVEVFHPYLLRTWLIAVMARPSPRRAQALAAHHALMRMAPRATV